LQSGANVLVPPNSGLKIALGGIFDMDCRNHNVPSQASTSSHERP
jgi:hypothetical protein